MGGVSQHVGDRRLLNLAEFLKTVPRKQFDYSLFVGDDWKGAADLSCGTTACALGWATTMPEFRRLGLRLRRYRDASGGGTVTRVGKRGDDDPFEHAAAIFGISLDEALDLFAPTYRIRGLGPSATPKAVAKHIERFVKSRQKAAAAA